jgi:hypothetical protein
MKHKNFPYSLTDDYKLIYEFLIHNSDFFLIGFTDHLPFHMFKMRQTIHTGDVVIMDSHKYMNHAGSSEEFEKICKELSLLIIEPEKISK